MKRNRDSRSLFNYGQFTLKLDCGTDFAFMERVAQKSRDVGWEAEIWPTYMIFVLKSSVLNKTPDVFPREPVFEIR